MSQLSRTEWEALYGTTGTVFPDNTTGEISEGDMRTFGKNASDSIPFTRNDSYTWAFPKADTSGTNTYAVTLSPAITAYTNGMKIHVKIKTASTGASTLNANTVGARKIFLDPTTQADSGDLIDEQEYIMSYDSALDSAVGGWLIIGGGGSGGGGATAAEDVTFTPAGNIAATDVQAAIEELGSSEFSRVWTSVLLFDKKEIDYASHELSEDAVFTVASDGHLENKFCSAVQTIITEGTFSITFSGFNFIYGIQNGEIPDAGTYQIFFMYRNGIATVHWATPSSEVANLETLGLVPSFAAAPDGENEIDLSWAAVTNASGYRIDFATTADGPWSLLTTLGSGSTSHSHTGLSGSTHIFYRIKALGDGVVYADSLYSTANATTEDSGDTDAPTFIFSEADSATDIPINKVITVTANEAIRKADGVALTNFNLGDVLTVKQTNGAGSDIPYTATINDAKTLITITPNVVWGTSQQVFIEIDNVEDVNGNESAADSLTFTTGDMTFMTGNFLNFDQQLNGVLTGVNNNFEIELDIDEMVLSGIKSFAVKYDSSVGPYSLIFAAENTDVVFKWYNASSGASASRELRWPAVLDSGAHNILLKYFGTVNTNNGLDRADLEIDGVPQGGKALTASGGSWPFGIATSTALFRMGPPYGLVKNLVIRNGSGTQLDVPVVRTGEDVSGNNRDGTWL